MKIFNLDKTYASCKAYLEKVKLGHPKQNITATLELHEPILDKCFVIKVSPELYCAALDG